VLQHTVIGSIIRTFIALFTRPSFFFPRGIFDGSKSGGMYLFRTLRSPMVNAVEFERFASGARRSARQPPREVVTRSRVDYLFI
jgi:hypothetical protein